MSTSKDLSTVKNALATYEFSNFAWVYCRPTIADLLKPDKRCGIYIFRFRNNEFYVGQAIDITRRFVQHTKIHDDIQEISFRIFETDKLDQAEKEIVRILEKKKIKLRNINLTNFPKGETDLDIVISPIEQNRWLTNTDVQNDLKEQVINHSELQDKYA